MGLDLRTGKTIWFLENGEPPAHKKLVTNIYSDVCVIGGGISGALLAFTLVEQGHQVALLDEREISAGSSMASTAILSYETDVMLTDLIKNLGERKAVRVFKAGNEALDYIEQTTRVLGNDCNFKRRDSIYLASEKSDYNDIFKEYSTRTKHDFRLDFLTDKEVSNLFSFSAAAALRTPGMAEVDPVQLTRRLIRYAENKGLSVFAQTKVNKRDYDHKSNISTLITENGFTVKCRHAVFATGYETQQMLKQKKVKLNSSYAIASEPVNDFIGWHARATIWESARPYLYLRTTADNRIVAGGEDETFNDEDKRDALIEAKTETLIKKVRQKFPEIPFKLATAWAGTFAESEDGLPYIGKHKKYPGAYFALGYGGNGITFSAMACNIILDLIAGRQNSDSEIFKFDR